MIVADWGASGQQPVTIATSGTSARRKGLAACTYIGRDMLADLIRPGCALTSLAAEGIRVEAASLTELCLTLLVREEDAQRTLRELHAALIPSNVNVVAYA